MSRVTLKDVAKAANVSVASASNVLNGRAHKVSAETAEHIRRVAGEMGYARNQNAAALKQGCSNMIWLLMPGLSAEEKDEKLLRQEHPFFMDFLSGIEKGTSACQLQFGSLRANSKQDLSPLLNGPRPKGVITLGLLSEDVESTIASWSIPTLVVDHGDFFDKYSENPHLTNYSIDDEKMGQTALQHLLELGHRHIVLLFGELGLSAVHQERYEGVKRLAEQYPQPVTLELIESPTSFSGVEQVFPQLQQKLEQGADAVLAMSDIQAIGVYRMASRAGMKIPQDFSLLGMDNLSLLNFLPYRLTTVSQAITHRGYYAVQQLAYGTVPAPLQPELIPGETTAPRA